MKANFPTKSHKELATQMNEVFIKLNYVSQIETSITKQMQEQKFPGYENNDDGGLHSLISSIHGIYEKLKAEDSNVTELKSEYESLISTPKSKDFIAKGDGLAMEKKIEEENCIIM